MATKRYFLFLGTILSFFFPYVSYAADHPISLDQATESLASGLSSIMSFLESETGLIIAKGLLVVMAIRVIWQVLSIFIAVIGRGD